MNWHALAPAVHHFGEIAGDANPSMGAKSITSIETNTVRTHILRRMRRDIR